VTNLALGAILLAVLLATVAVMLWQEARNPGRGERVYGVGDSVDFIWQRLDSDTRARLLRSGVQRIIEWEIFYLQGLAQDDRRHQVDIVAGGYPPAVEFIIDRIAARHKVAYAERDVSSVLHHEAAYLEAIGAVGPRVGGSEE
jgi:hypothetical protein